MHASAQPQVRLSKGPTRRASAGARLPFDRGASRTVERALHAADRIRDEHERAEAAHNQ